MPINSGPRKPSTPPRGHQTFTPGRAKRDAGMFPSARGLVVSFLQQVQKFQQVDARGVCDPTAFRFCGANHMSERRVTASEAGPSK
jgi:hypothetical protein